jgi:hypothetical protein
MAIAPLTDDQLFAGLELAQSVRDDLPGRSILRYYALKEVEELAGAARPKSVGGPIVADALVGPLAGEPPVYLGVNPAWTRAATTGAFTLSDLINVAIPALETPTAPPYGG